MNHWSSYENNMRSVICQVLSPYRLWEWRYNGFSLSRDLARPRNGRFMKLYEWDPLFESFTPAKFHRDSRHGTRDILVLVCHVIP